MTHEITPPDHFVAGESLIQEFTIEEDGSAKDISGADVSWQLLPKRGADASEALYDETTTGISVNITDAANGRVDVEINQDTVTDGGCRLWQRLIVDDNNEPGKQIWNGDFRVYEA